MQPMEIVGGAIVILISLVIIFVVLLQESPKGNGISALTGGDSYYNKNQGRSREATLQRVTKISAALFFVITVVVYAVVMKP